MKHDTSQHGKRITREDKHDCKEGKEHNHADNNINKSVIKMK